MDAIPEAGETVVLMERGEGPPWEGEMSREVLSGLRREGLKAIPVTRLNLSVRAGLALQRNHLATLWDLNRLTVSQVERLVNIGKPIRDEVIQVVRAETGYQLSSWMLAGL